MGIVRSPDLNSPTKEEPMEYFFQVSPTGTSCCSPIHVFALVVRLSSLASDATIPSNCSFGYLSASRDNHPTETVLTLEPCLRPHQGIRGSYIDTGVINRASIMSACNGSYYIDDHPQPQPRWLPDEAPGMIPEWKDGIAMFEYYFLSIRGNTTTTLVRRTEIHHLRDDFSFNVSSHMQSILQQERNGGVHYSTPFIGLPSIYSQGHRASQVQPFRHGNRVDAGAATARKLLVTSENPARSGLHGEDHGAALRRCRAGVVASVAVAITFGLLCFATGLLFWCAAGKSMLHPDLWRAAGPVPYRYSELVSATSNFAAEKQLGGGGFGQVYRGCLVTDMNRHVAVKVLSSESSLQGRKEFEAEVKVMSRLRHRNLVQLVGWCDTPERLLLVYELASEGSLDKHLYCPGRSMLTWPDRYRIALGVGSAVLYLHTECEQCVVHGDIKPSNVMLDSSRTAKLGDFGLARLVDHGAEPQTTQVVAGTVGYIDPEFVNTRRPSTESDVYSFGVVLLEIACGRRPTAVPGQPADEAPSLLRCVRDMYDRDAVLEAADGRLNGEFDRRQMKRVLVTGLWCAHCDRRQRPTIAKAMAALRSEDASLPVLTELHGPRSIRQLEEQAYGELSGDASESTLSSAATAYHTPDDSGYLFR